MTFHAYYRHEEPLLYEDDEDDVDPLIGGSSSSWNHLHFLSQSQLTPSNDEGSLSNGTGNKKRSLFQRSNEGRKKKDEEITIRMMDETNKMISRVADGSRLFVDDNDALTTTMTVPRFDPKEIVLETTVGMGEFGIIYKVGNICCCHEGNDSDSNSGKGGSEIDSSSLLRRDLARNFNHNHCVAAATAASTNPKMIRRRSLSSGALSTATADTAEEEWSASTTSERQINHESGVVAGATASTVCVPDDGSDLFVVKQIRKDLYPNNKVDAAKALAREAMILSRLQELYSRNSKTCRNAPATVNHPNLIALRGTMSDIGRLDFGLVLDRLHLTLTELSTSWSIRQGEIVEARGAGGAGSKHPLLHRYTSLNREGSDDPRRRKSLTVVETSSAETISKTAVVASTAEIVQSTFLPQRRRRSNSLYVSKESCSSCAPKPSSWLTGLKSLLGTGHGGGRKNFVSSNDSYEDDSASCPGVMRQQHQHQPHHSHRNDGLQHQQSAPSRLSSSLPSLHLSAFKSVTTDAPMTTKDTTTASKQRSTLALETSGYSTESILLLGERVLALYDVAEGMKFLHSHKIIFRDLKTENICNRKIRCSGSTGKAADAPALGGMQIFDFGLARECKQSDRVQVTAVTDDENDEVFSHTPPSSSKISNSTSFYDSYRMTGMTGTLRIMAPEVIQCAPYGLPADVYSFGMCMWEVFEGTRCNFLSPAEICNGSSLIGRSTQRRRSSMRPTVPESYFNDVESGYGEDYEDDGIIIVGNDAFNYATGTTASNHSSSDNIGVGMPKQLQRLLQQCWSDEPRDRPTFDEISRRLRSLLVELLLHHRKQNQQHQSTANDDVKITKTYQSEFCNSTKDAFWYRLETIFASSFT